MITKYQAMTLHRGKTVIGYVVYVDNQYYLYQEDGRRVLVDGSSITPIPKDSAEEQKEGIKKDKHPLCCLGLSEYIINNIGFSGVKYLEELESWTDMDYDKVRGIGPMKKRQIKDVLEQYNLKFNGTV